MRAFAFNEFETFCGACRAEDGEADVARELDGRGADSAACSVDENGFCGSRFGFVLERVISGGVGNEDAGALREADVGGRAWT